MFALDHSIWQIGPYLQFEKSQYWKMFLYWLIIDEGLGQWFQLNWEEKREYADSRIWTFFVLIFFNNENKSTCVDLSCIDSLDLVIINLQHEIVRQDNIYISLLHNTCVICFQYQIIKSLMNGTVISFILNVHVRHRPKCFQKCFEINRSCFCKPIDLKELVFCFYF